MATRKKEAPYDPHEAPEVTPGIDEIAAEEADRESNDPLRAELAPVDNGEPFVPATTREVMAEGRVVDRQHDMGLGKFIDYDDLDEEAAAETTYRSIIAQVMAGSSIEEVLTPPEAISARNMTGVPLVISGFHVNTSEYDVGSPYYFSMDCRRVDTDEKCVINSGNQRIMAQLLRLYMLDQLNSGKTEADLNRDGVPADARFGTAFEAYIRPAKRANRHGGIPLWLDARPPEAWK